MTSLNGKTLFISGATRGIGLAIALRAARDGANIAIAAKTSDPHPKLPGVLDNSYDSLGEEFPLFIHYLDLSSNRILNCVVRFSEKSFIDDDPIYEISGEFG